MSLGGRAPRQRHAPGDPGWYKRTQGGDILKLAVAATAEPYTDRNDPDGDPEIPICRGCTAVIHVEQTPTALEATPLCHLCAQDASYALGAELLRIHELLKTFPPPISAVFLSAINEGAKSGTAQKFIDDVLKQTKEHVLKAERKAARVRRKK